MGENLLIQVKTTNKTDIFPHLFFHPICKKGLFWVGVLLCVFFFGGGRGFGGVALFRVFWCPISHIWGIMLIMELLVTNTTNTVD